MVFFSKNKKTAVTYAKKVAKKEGRSYKEPKLSKQQIPHIQGWKTWTQGWN